jgi:hypothetical protein
MIGCSRSLSSNGMEGELEDRNECVDRSSYNGTYVEYQESFSFGHVLEV